MVRRRPRIHPHPSSGCLPDEAADLVVKALAVLPALRPSSDEAMVDDLVVLVSERRVVCHCRHHLLHCRDQSDRLVGGPSLMKAAQVQVRYLYYLVSRPPNGKLESQMEVQESLGPAPSELAQWRGSVWIFGRESRRRCAIVSHAFQERLLRRCEVIASAYICASRIQSSSSSPSSGPPGPPCTFLKYFGCHSIPCSVRFAVSSRCRSSILDFSSVAAV